MHFMVYNPKEEVSMEKMFDFTYTYRDGRKVAKWRCGSTNKAGGARVCSNCYVLEEAFVQLFIMSWNEIAGNYADYLECWNKNLEKDNELLRHKQASLWRQPRKVGLKNLTVSL